MRGECQFVTVDAFGRNQINCDEFVSPDHRGLVVPDLTVREIERRLASGAQICSKKALASALQASGFVPYVRCTVVHVDKVDFAEHRCKVLFCDIYTFTHLNVKCLQFCYLKKNIFNDFTRF